MTDVRLSPGQLGLLDLCKARTQWLDQRCRVEETRDHRTPMSPVLWWGRHGRTRQDYI